MSVTAFDFRSRDLPPITLGELADEHRNLASRLDLHFLSAPLINPWITRSAHQSSELWWTFILCIVVRFSCSLPSLTRLRIMDPIVLYYGKWQLTRFLVDPNGVLDVDINIYYITSSVVNPLDFQDLSELLYEHYNSSPYMDSKGRPINVPSMKLFSSMEDFNSM